MNRYPTNPVLMGNLFNRSVRLHYLTLKHTIFYIALIALIKNIVFYLAGLTANFFLDALIFIVGALFIIYFYAAALLATHEAFCDQPQSIKTILLKIKERIFTIYASFILYIVGTIAVYYFVKLILIAAGRLIHEPSAIHGGLLIIGWALIFVYIAIFYFSISLCIIKSTSLKEAFYDSMLQTERVKFNVFVLYAILGAIALLISPVMLHEDFLSTYHLATPFDFVVLCVLAPLYLNLTLLSIHDATLQLETEE
ncbi:MAG: putative membrane spanning protein [uncultured bacterium]|nr:MAG: putative membrane spanning protein [uncultured bacterium]